MKIIITIISAAVMLCVGCSSVKTEETNTNMNNYAQISQNTQSQTSSSELKISDDIFDVLTRPLGRPLAENMKPLSRKTWEYQLVAIMGSDLKNVYDVTRGKINEDSYENQNRIDMSEIHGAKNNRVYSISLLWKSKNLDEVDTIRKKFIDLAEKKFGSTGKYNEGIAKTISPSITWEDSAVSYSVHSIAKHEDDNYILYVWSLGHAYFPVYF